MSQSDLRALTEDDHLRIDGAVQHFSNNKKRFSDFAESLLDHFAHNTELLKLTHFLKHRVKEEESLRKKLERYALSDEPQIVDAANLFDRVRDLAGIRIIHLHTEQLAEIHPLILNLLHENQYKMIDEPTAYCWDQEFKKLFQDIGIRAKTRDSMYTTVHYDVLSNKTTKIACEIQVRSLVDEVWGEVSHRVNYPKPSPSETCQDQLKVLARLTSGCGRLVDSIFKTHIRSVSQGSA